MRCSATIDDRNHPVVNASMQRIIQPGRKKCSRNAREKVSHLWLCAAHARLARSGLVDISGNVAPKTDRDVVRRFPERFPHGLHRWVREGGE